MVNVMRQCVRPACSFRFPGPDSELLACPKCGSTTNITDFVLNEHPVREYLIQDFLPHLEVGLDNLRSVLNVGSIFRTSDGAGIKHIHLFGTSPPPTHPKMDKTALGASDHIPWSQYWDGASTVKELISDGVQVWCLEYTPKSTELFQMPLPTLDTHHLLIVGNENNGIDPQILDQAHHIVHLPMLGHKESLNVACAFTVAVYWFQFFNRGNHGYKKN